MRPVIWSRKAHQDIRQIVHFIAQDDPNAAARVAELIVEAGDKLGALPTGRPGRETGIYEKSLSRLPYIIAYKVRPVKGRESVVILRVIHTARDWPSGQWPQ
jgi:toxin ParE1/3/4